MNKVCVATTCFLSESCGSILQSVVKAEWHLLKKKCFPDMLALLVGPSVGVVIH